MAVIAHKKGKMKIENTLRWILHALMHADITLVVAVTSLIPMTFLVLAVYVGTYIFHGPIPVKISAGMLAITSLLESVPGLIQAVRKEAPGVMSMHWRGRVAIFTGLLSMALFLGGFFVSAYFWLVG